MLTALLLMGVLLNRYFISKLLEMYAVEELAKLIRVSRKGDDVVINDVNPEMVATNVMRELSGVKAVGLKMMQATRFRSAEAGSRTLINAAEGSKETQGQYMNDCKITKCISTWQGMRVCH